MTLLMGLPVALSIAGSDSGGNAGIQADLLTFAAHGVFGTTAIAATTAQNPDGVISVQAADPQHLSDQICQVLDYFPVSAVKIGMLANKQLVETVAATLSTYAGKMAIVLDPVMVSSSGALLLAQDAVDALGDQLLPLATLVTPNLDEAAVMLKQTSPITENQLLDCATELSSRWKVPFFLKGGHLQGSTLIDVCCTPDGRQQVWRGERIEGVDTHGSGCTLSSAIAANLSLGHALEASITRARDYLRNGMRHSLCINGKHFINHFPPG